MVSGTPNIVIHLDNNASDMVVALVSGLGNASGHLLKRSMTVDM